MHVDIGRRIWFEKETAKNTLQGLRRLLCQETGRTPVIMMSVINGGGYVSSAGDKAKEELDNKLKETLENGHYSEQSTPDNFNPLPRAKLEP